jgi:hypothetical protein
MGSRYGSYRVYRLFISMHRSDPRQLWGRVENKVGLPWQSSSGPGATGRIPTMRKQC